MGRNYSIGGFLNAVLRRNGKTILVEGVSDKLILHGLSLGLFSEETNFSIDHAGMIEDKELFSLGNKEKIKVIITRAEQLNTTNPKILKLMATLKDREWDGVDVDDFSLAHWKQPIQDPPNFTTVGHSIENYHFDENYIIDYLKFSYPMEISLKIIEEIKSSINASIVLAVVLSLEVKKNFCLNKIDGLLSIEHIFKRNEKFYLNESFTEACKKRNISCHSTIADNVNFLIDEKFLSLSQKESSKWIAHGHLGSSVIWACAGFAAASCGLTNNLAIEIGQGKRLEKLKFFSFWSKQLEKHRMAPLVDSLEWLHARS